MCATPTTGHALYVHGKTYFSRTGGGTVATGHSTHAVSVSGLTSSDLVLVTLQTANAGMYVLGAVPATGKFTLHLSKNAPHPTKFAWFVLK